MMSSRPLAPSQRDVDRFPTRCLDFFRDLTEQEAEAAMDEFSQSDIVSIRNKSAFLMSILRCDVRVCVCVRGLEGTRRAGCDRRHVTFGRVVNGLQPYESMSDELTVVVTHALKVIPG